VWRIRSAKDFAQVHPQGIAQGELDVVTSAVQDLTGEPAEDVKSFLARKDALLASPTHRPRRVPARSRWSWRPGF
jgi:hypothetical protein